MSKSIIIVILAIMALLILPVSALPSGVPAGEYATYVAPCWTISSGDCSAGYFPTGTNIAWTALGGGHWQEFREFTTCNNGFVTGDSTVIFPAADANGNYNLQPNKMYLLKTFFNDAYFYRTTPYQNASVLFSVSETGNFTKKLSGVTITLSNGQTNTTNSNGQALIKVYPNSSTLTYTLSKTGYYTEWYTALGGYGETGGTLQTTMTVDEGMIPPGNVRTYFQNLDLSGHHIHGSNVFIQDETLGLWQNWSNDDDGTGYIDSPTTSRLSGYGTATGYDSASRQNVTPGDFVYEIIMNPTGLLTDPGTGNVNLIVIINDRGTGAALSGVSVAAVSPSGSTQATVTSGSGTAQFAVPNNSVIHLSASKSGYDSATKITTTTAFGPDTVRIELDKTTVTATVTSTPYPGEITTRPTYIAGCEPGGDPATCATNQDANLWVQLRDQSSLIMTLALLAVIIGLVKIMGK